MYVSTEDMRINLKTKRGFLRFQQTQKYCRTAKKVLELVEVILVPPICNSISHNLIGRVRQSGAQGCKWKLIFSGSPGYLT